MDKKEALLDKLAELKETHDKANRMMMEITAVAAKALKGGGPLPSLDQLRQYEQALAKAQGLAGHCAGLMQETGGANAVGAPNLAVLVR